MPKTLELQEEELFSVPIHSNQLVVCSRKKFKERIFYDLRVWYFADGENHENGILPSKKGMILEYAELKALRRALSKIA